MNPFIKSIKSRLTLRFIAGVLSLVTILASSLPLAAVAAEVTSTATLQTANRLSDDENFDGFVIPDKKTVKTIRADITAYTSTVEECDGSPFITADGSVVRDGIIATNILPFGTKVRIPAYFGNRVFEVRDRMNGRYAYRIDIWMSDQQAMRQWGLKRNAVIEVVEMGTGKKNWDQWKGRTIELNRVGKYGPDA